MSQVLTLVSPDRAAVDAAIERIGGVAEWLKNLIVAWLVAAAVLMIAFGFLQQPALILVAVGLALSIVYLRLFRFDEHDIFLPMVVLIGQGGRDIAGRSPDGRA